MSEGKETPTYAWLQRKVPMYQVIGDLLQLELRLDELTDKSIVGTHTIEKNHKLIQAFCKRMLELEGFDPVYDEVTISGFPTKYRADVVGYKDGKAHTVIEIGTLTDPAKIQLFSQAFPRFIWMPFVPILNMEELNRTCAVLEKWPQLVEQLNRDFKTIRVKILHHLTEVVDNVEVEVAEAYEQCRMLREQKDKLEKDVEMLREQVRELGKPANYTRREITE